MINLKDLRKLKNLDRDDLLSLVGLETERTVIDWIAPTLGAFSVGVLVGAGIGLLLAPKSGSELRSDLRSRIQGVPESLGNSFGSTSSEKPSSRSI